jgi:hypothetical protein
VSAKAGAGNVHLPCWQQLRTTSGLPVIRFSSPRSKLSARPEVESHEYLKGILQPERIGVFPIPPRRG